MPTSHTGQINTIVDLITTINPRSILDIGTGHGKYGFLSREYLEVANDKLHYGKRKVRIDGVEGFPDYISALQKEIYDTIYIGDALEVVDTIPSTYELILMIDVFEHFSKEDGLSILSKCLKKSAHILISCPKNMDEQGADHGNEYQSHKFQWKKKHFKNFECAFIPNYYSLICLIGPKSRTIKSNWRKSNLKIRIGAMFPVIRNIYLKIKRKD